MDAQLDIEILKSQFSQIQNKSFGEMTGPGKVMLVDDNDDFREGLKEILELHGWLVEDQSCVQDALKKLKLSAVLPDVIILDYLMPLENGIYFWNALNDDQSLCHIPTIMVTAHEMNSINVVGVRAVVKKPVDTDELFTLLNTLRNERKLNLASHTLM